MKKLVPILALVVLVAAIVLVVLRPGSGGGDPGRPGGLVDGIGGLLPSRDVAASDLTGRPCWASGVLTVPAGGSCTTQLPDGATRLRVCVTAGVPDVRVQGSSYGAQHIAASHLGCAGPEPIRLYDQGSRLTVTCLGPVPCRLRLA
ncbi:MAG TPA: hypothetical protein VLS51_09575 [Propionibacteriaceae bacterium]|nr:hypothetical protein [Propionibacteriaceae bacterium]